MNVPDWGFGVRTKSSYYKKANGFSLNSPWMCGPATGWTVRESIPGMSVIFRTYPDQPCGPPSVLYNGFRVFPGGKERPESDADPSPTSSAVGHERVDLYLYSPYGPYDLYRDLVPEQGWTLPYLTTSLFVLFSAPFKQTVPPSPVTLSSCPYKQEGFSHNSVTSIQSIHITLRL